MTDGIKGTVGSVADRITDAASSVADAVKSGVGAAAGWAEDKLQGVQQWADQEARDAAIDARGRPREGMDVIGACGTKLGVVDRAEGGDIKLTRNDSPDGQHHLIPAAWVARVDEHVHLTKDCDAARREWRTA